MVEEVGEKLKEALGEVHDFIATPSIRARSLFDGVPSFGPELDSSQGRQIGSSRAVRPRCGVVQPGHVVQLLLPRVLRPVLPPGIFDFVEHGLSGKGTASRVGQERHFVGNLVSREPFPRGRILLHLTAPGLQALFHAVLGVSFDLISQPLQKIRRASDAKRMKWTTKMGGFAKQGIAKAIVTETLGVPSLSPTPKPPESGQFDGALTSSKGSVMFDNLLGFGRVSFVGVCRLTSRNPLSEKRLLNHSFSEAAKLLPARSFRKLILSSQETFSELSLPRRFRQDIRFAKVRTRSQPELLNS